MRNRYKWLLTAENEDVTPLPQLNFPLDTPQGPLDVDIVKLDAEPESLYVAGVWVDQVPALRRPPVEPTMR